MKFRLHFLGAEFWIQQLVLKKRLLWPTYFDFPIYFPDKLFCNNLTYVSSLIFSVLILRVLNCCLLCYCMPSSQHQDLPPGVFSDGVFGTFPLLPFWPNTALPETWTLSSQPHAGRPHGMWIPSPWSLDSQFMVRSPTTSTFWLSWPTTTDFMVSKLLIPPSALAMLGQILFLVPVKLQVFHVSSWYILYWYLQSF